MYHVVVSVEDIKISAQGTDAAALDVKLSNDGGAWTGKMPVGHVIQLCSALLAGVDEGDTYERAREVLEQHSVPAEYSPIP